MLCSRVVLLGVLESCWNTFPSTEASSLSLHVCHGLILLGLMWGKTAGQSGGQKTDGGHSIGKHKMK